MQIVFIDTTITTPPTGGAHTFLVDICMTLAAKGWQTVVVSQPGQDDSLLQKMRAGGVEVKTDLWRKSHLPEERAQRLAQWVNQRKPNIFVVSASADVGWLALPQLPLSTATISIAHNDTGSFYNPLVHYHSFIDIAVAVSAEIRRKIVALGVSEARARQIPYGIKPISKDDLMERSNAQSLQVAYVGRVVQEQKRVMEMVPLALGLKERGVKFLIHVIGDGSGRASLMEASEAEGVSDCFKFWGWQSTARVSELLRRMDVFLLLSEFEGLPVALLEAMGHGLAPVVSRIASGNTEVVSDGENGYLVDVGNIGGFAEKLEKLANDREALVRMQHTAWQSSQNYTVEMMVKRYEECFAAAGSAGFSREHRRRADGSYALMPSCVSRYPFWLRKIKYFVRELAG